MPNECGWRRQELFDLMSREHGLTLLESEMDEIEDVVKKMIFTHPRAVDTTNPVFYFYMGVGVGIVLGSIICTLIVMIS